MTAQANCHRFAGPSASLRSPQDDIKELAQDDRKKNSGGVDEQEGHWAAAGDGGQFLRDGPARRPAPTQVWGFTLPRVSFGGVGNCTLTWRAPAAGVPSASLRNCTLTYRALAAGLLSREVTGEVSEAEERLVSWRG